MADNNIQVNQDFISSEVKERVKQQILDILNTNLNEENKTITQKYVLNIMKKIQNYIAQTDSDTANLVVLYNNIVDTINRNQAMANYINKMNNDFQIKLINALQIGYLKIEEIRNDLIGEVTKIEYYFNFSEGGQRKYYKIQFDSIKDFFNSKFFNFKLTRESGDSGASSFMPKMRVNARTEAIEGTKRRVNMLTEAARRVKEKEKFENYTITNITTDQAQFEQKLLSIIPEQSAGKRKNKGVMNEAYAQWKNIGGTIENLNNNDSLIIEAFNRAKGKGFRTPTFFQGGDVGSIQIKSAGASLANLYSIIHELHELNKICVGFINSGNIQEFQQKIIENLKPAAEIGTDIVVQTINKNINEMLKNK